MVKTKREGAFRVEWWHAKCKFWYTGPGIHTHSHTLTHKCKKGCSVWLINSFLCWEGVMTADSSQSPEDQRVTPLINWARWNVKLSLSLSKITFTHILPLILTLHLYLWLSFFTPLCCIALNLSLSEHELRSATFTEPVVQSCSSVVLQSNTTIIGFY